VVERRLRPKTIPPIAGGAGPIAGGPRPVVEVPSPVPGQRFRPSRVRKAREAARREVAELAQDADRARVRTALRRGLTIAVAIGLHNFAEGLAIGVAARAGAAVLATVLIIGFALHNATEGFGIVGPLGDVVPSWRWLGAAGLIAGGPTFLGAMVGYAVTSVSLELAFYALAGGAILYVIGEIWHAMRRYGFRELGLFMLAAGFMIGVVTDLVVSYGGG
jgi:ZIP family zinc transporter